MEKMNASDIESISVLKDAAGTAIYGAKELFHRYWLHMELPWPSIKSACCVKECCPVFRSLPRCPLKNVPQSIKMKEIKKILQKAIAPAESTRYTEIQRFRV